VKYQVTHATQYRYSAMTPVCYNLVHLTPRQSPRQRCREFRLEIAPEPAHVTSRQDYFGNQSSHFSIHQSHEGLKVTAQQPGDADVGRAVRGGQVAELGVDP
jgi:transglutaminase-like putative cysteine protease